MGFHEYYSESMKQVDDLGKISRSISDFYEKYGSDFSTTRRYPWGVMKLLEAYIKPGMTLVDVGAGNARLAGLVPDPVFYFAVEPSSTLREQALKNVSDRLNCQVASGALPTLPLDDNQSDLTACFAVLHHVPGTEKRLLSIIELARITKPGGRLILTVWNLRSRRFFTLKNWLAAWLRLPLIPGGGFGDVMVPWKNQATRYVHCFTKREMKRLFNPKIWEIEKLEYWGNDGPERVLNARNLVLVARKKL